jgi:hypothetical protein
MNQFDNYGYFFECLKVTQLIKKFPLMEPRGS